MPRHKSFGLKMSRKVARDTAFKLTFEFLFSGSVNEYTKEKFFENAQLTDEDKKYIDAVFNGVVDDFRELNRTIEKYAVGYKLDRIYKPDYAVLLNSIFEIKNMRDIPYAVTINEAIELVKAYSDEKSHKFVHGILTSVVKEVQNGNN